MDYANRGCVIVSNYVMKKGLESCCKDAYVDDAGIQIGGCKQTSVRDYRTQCVQGSQGISVALNWEYGFYYNISVDEHHRPHGCQVILQRKNLKSRLIEE